VGVTSPTKKLNAQFVAVERETPFARTVRGRIFYGYVSFLRPKKAILEYLWGIQPRNRTPAEQKHIFKRIHNEQ
jgi:hypothetical protein